MKASRQRLKVFIATAFAIGLTGCSTISQEQFDEAMSMAKQAQQEASDASRAASAAQRAADDAKRTASAAQSAASAAQSAASDSSKCCAANSEKIERMFQESMRK